MKKHNIHTKLIGLLAISIIAYMSMSVTTVANAFSDPTKTCSLSLELQNQQARMLYANRLAAVVGNQPTTVEAMYQNTELATFSDENDSGDGFTLFSFGEAPNDEAPSSTTLQGIDQFSVECLSCHDGVTATLVQPKIKEFPSTNKTFSSRSAKDHSIGMRYEFYTGTGKYKPVVDLGSNMLFVDGKVGCLTCHNPLNPEKNHLAKSDARSALCMTCHIR